MRPLSEPSAGQMQLKGPCPSPVLLVSNERALVPARRDPTDTGVCRSHIVCAGRQCGQSDTPSHMRCQLRRAAGRAALQAASCSSLLFVFVGTEAKARLTKWVKTRALMPGLLCCHCGRSRATTGTTPGHFTSKQSSACGNDKT